MVANLKTKGFQVCDSRAVENFSGLWQISFNTILPQTSNTIFIHKCQDEIPYKEDTVYLRDNINYTTFAFYSLFRVLAVFPKMKGFFYNMKAETIKVYWGIMLSSYIYFLGGHYPGAKNILFADSLLDKHTHMLKTPQQLLRGWLNVIMDCH